MNTTEVRPIALCRVCARQGHILFGPIRNYQPKLLGGKCDSCDRESAISSGWFTPSEDLAEDKPILKVEILAYSLGILGFLLLAFVVCSMCAYGGVPWKP